MAIFRERSKSRFCISPGKRPVTEIDHVTGNEKQKKKNALNACSSSMNKQMKAKKAPCDPLESK